jgi:hypothetical protein
MKKNLRNFLLPFILVTALAFTFGACNDNEDPAPEGDCSTLSDDLEELYDQLDEVGYDCEEMPKLFDEIIELLNKRKTCPQVEELASDEGYDNVDDYISDLEEQFEMFMNDCPG